jgi:hypothetical protein
MTISRTILFRLLAHAPEELQLLMDAGEYEHAAIVADEAITEAVARYLHKAMLEKEER